jgi:RHS repeat-associated protein
MKLRHLAVWLLLFANALAAGAVHAQASLAAGQSLAGAGGYVDANWSNVSPANQYHWVGVYVPGSANNTYKAWRYLNSATASGSVNITLPTNLTLGTYELRLFAAGGGYNLLAQSGTFTVGRGIKGLMTVGAAPVQHATIVATNGGVCTNSYLTGDYSCGVASGWSGTVTPSHYQYVFSPTSRNYSNVVSNQTSQNYAASVVYHLTGNISLSGSPAAGVTLSGTGATCTQTDSSGNYDCTVPSGWSGTIIPAYSGYTFSPASRNYSNVTANQASQGYTVVTYQVSGTATLNTVPLANVAFSGTNGASCTTSNTSGEYSCTVVAGWSGTVTPAATGYAFTPGSRNYTSIAADAPNEDYPATLQTPTATISFVHVDHLNTPRAVSSIAQQTIWRWDQTEPFGVSAPNEDPDGNSIAYVQPLRFPGQYADKETGLHYNYFRDYDGLLGRYVESDPIGLAGGINTYAYVENDVLRYTDPTGEVVFVPVLAGVAAGYLFDYLLKKYREEYCRCIDTNLGAAGNTALGGVVGATGPFGSKSRTGISGGGPAGGATSSFSQLNHAAASRGWISTPTRNTLTRAARKVPYVGTALVAFEIYDAFTCENENE